MKKCYTCQMLKDISEFNRNRARRDGLNSICKICSRARSKKYYHDNTNLHKKNVLKRNRKVRKIIQKWLQEIKKTGCILCNEKEICCIDFHHLYDKKYEVRELLSSYRLTQAVAEINKCVLLCANCHRKVHKYEIQIDKKYLCNVQRPNTKILNVPRADNSA